MMLAALQGAALPAACLRAGSTLLQHCLSLDLSQVRTSRTVLMWGVVLAIVWHVSTMVAISV